jgi:hypothetical protein
VPDTREMTGLASRMATVQPAPRAGSTGPSPNHLDSFSILTLRVTGRLTSCRGPGTRQDVSPASHDSQRDGRDRDQHGQPDRLSPSAPRCAADLPDQRCERAAAAIIAALNLTHFPSLNGSEPRGL